MPTTPLPRDDPPDNVIHFPLPSARQQLLAALKPHMHSGAMLIPWLHEVGIEGYPEPALRHVAGHLEFCHQHHLPAVPWHATPRVIDAAALKWLLIAVEALLPRAEPVLHLDGGLVIRQQTSPELWFVSPKEKDQVMIRITERYPELMTPWEQRFLGWVKYHRRLSEKQVAVLDGLFARAVAVHCERCERQ